MTNTIPLSRRSFLATGSAAGGGLVLGLRLPMGGDGTAAAATGAEVNAWVVIAPDETVTVRFARSEMGQGISTGLPMLVAEELDCDWSKVRSEPALAHDNLARKQAWGNMATGGSQSTRSSHDYLRKAGATAKAMLIAAAAQGWGVAPAECTVDAGKITHKPSGRTTTYGAVADAAAKLAPPAEVTLKSKDQFKILGKPTKRLDTPLKVDGSAQYAIDVKVPGMLYAAMAHCPVFGGSLKSYDEAKIKAMPGFRAVVPVKGGLAVVADQYWQARKALDALPVVWDDGGNGKVSTATIRDFMREGLEAATGVAVARNEGDAKGALAKAAKVVEAEYEVPFLAHACMEPMNATADVRADGVTVWAPSQNATAALAAAAEAAGVEPAKVKVHVPFLGGGFGRRGFQDYVSQAVTVSKAVGKPVKLIWSREEDIQHDFYRPMAFARLRAGLDAQGNAVALWHRYAGQSIMAQVRPTNIKDGVDAHLLSGLVDPIYGYPNQLLDLAIRNTAVPMGFWRAVNHTQNVFITESFVDEMAHAAGADPVEFRRRLLAKYPLGLNVLDAAAKAAGWGTPLPKGVARGVAVAHSYGSHCAEVVEASLDAKTGRPRVHRVVAALDCGTVVNPAQIEAQVSGSVVWALTAALEGEITIKDGRVEQGNFHDYFMLRMDEMPPKIEVHLVPKQAEWGGIGEPAVPPFAPALCNALFALTGKRVRKLPLKHHDLRAA